ncbi:MAG: beta-galactosidase [Candidatus Saccharimonadales bacterium]
MKLSRSTSRRLLYSCGALSLSLGIAFLVVRFIPHSTPEYGVTFSAKYAEELGLDPNETLEAILSELKPAHVRLMSYWDRHERDRDRYDFTELDQQFDLAERYEVEVLLAIGQRQPRWPECHVPEWAKQLSNTEYEMALLKYLHTVTDRYADQPRLEGYHLENEAANASFGRCPPFNNGLLRQEYATVTAADPDTPITISVSNQYGIPLQPPLADEYAMSIYRQAYFELGGRQIYWNYSFVPAEWHRLRAWAIQLIHCRKTYIHELQTEPWGRQATVNLSLAEQAASMDPDKLRANVNYAERIGTPKIYLWGGEWWYWRLQKFDDPTLWHTVQAIFNQPEI